jgi:hypothetical protein
VESAKNKESKDKIKLSRMQYGDVCYTISEDIPHQTAFLKTDTILERQSTQTYADFTTVIIEMVFINGIFLMK